MAKKRELTAVGGDVFAGLFTVGIKQAGFRVAAHLEHSTYGAKTCRLNHPEVRLYHGVASWPAAEDFPPVDLMFTNPPCALWSAARVKNIKTNYLTDPRNTWVPDLVDAALGLKARAFVWESVTNAWKNGRPYVLDQAQRFANAGYSVTVILQNNMYLGVPQNRPRMLFVAHRHPLVRPPLQDPITVREALRGLKVPKRDKVELAPHLAKLWAMSENGRTLWDNHQLLEVKEREGHTAPSFLCKRARFDRVGHVLLGGLDKQLHPTESRYFTYAEYLRLAAAPPDWQSAGSLSAATGELSRAVMPPVGYWLGCAVRDGLAKPALRTPQYKLVNLLKPEAPYTEDLW